MRNMQVKDMQDSKEGYAEGLNRLLNTSTDILLTVYPMEASKFISLYMILMGINPPKEPPFGKSKESTYETEHGSLNLSIVEILDDGRAIIRIAYTSYMLEV